MRSSVKTDDVTKPVVIWRVMLDTIMKDLRAQKHEWGCRTMTTTLSMRLMKARKGQTQDNRSSNQSVMGGRWRRDGLQER